MPQSLSIWRPGFGERLQGTDSQSVIPLLEIKLTQAQSGGRVARIKRQRFLIGSYSLLIELLACLLIASAESGIILGLQALLALDRKTPQTKQNKPNIVFGCFGVIHGLEF